MVSFAEMMRKQIVMPAHLMDDGKHGILNGGRNLFSDFSEVAERIGGEQAGRHGVASWAGASGGMRWLVGAAWMAVGRACSGR
jgi:hypothetical protein